MNVRQRELKVYLVHIRYTLLNCVWNLLLIISVGRQVLRRLETSQHPEQGKIEGEVPWITFKEVQKEKDS